MRWNILPLPNLGQTRQLAESLNVDTLIAQLLLQRGITDFDQAKNFFRPSLSELHDPFLMTDMDIAVARIESAIENNESILIFGDYDVDGTTAVSLLSTYLKSYHQNVDTYIPDRYGEGYGVSFQGIDYADDNGCSLIIALDCGIKSISHVDYATEKGIDFIICDHHRPGDILPKAVAVLDPKREDCSYPYDELCGCGVGFKLIQALGSRRGQTIDDLVGYLDLVATAIAADIVPMTGENRILARYGLEVINSNPRPGIAALMKSLKKSKFDISDVVFTVAPRINAAGRIRHGQHAVNLLCETNVDIVSQYASEIEQYNIERKGLDKRITQEALSQITDNSETDRFTTVVYQEDWHKGVIGIVASRLIETYYRPTLVFTKSDTKLAASARSVRGFDVYNALEACSEHLEQFGGHMYAAGLTLKEENFNSFKSQFEEVVSQTMPDELREAEITIDAEVNLSELSPKTMRILKQFEPFGPENMTPVFMAKGLQDTGFAKVIGETREHLRLQIRQDRSEAFGAVGFGLAPKIGLVEHKKTFDAVFCLDENEWNGKVDLQLRIKDIR
ncbi:single-stranded-DNA-specific exonuclease RecJ [Flavobacterium silvaticum]|uniref:Single-stranded-DNA-specific exonuclease RecJ n=1 Tax=Flavobacterium silvaticum TaxID=1852020 RepID=A0A972FKM4_9FLAO|nr:single-stranded-DNA-specific exonuclease RecJ [Flavobacterium silvaticum]NMH27721.1 single-stranded-DNA-specific exonuclease RecJ [Flavobacterium silvaticum]